MAEKIIELTSKNFDELTSKGNWVIDFWAEWCGPCKMMEPEFEKVAQETQNKIKFGKINVDEEGELAQKFDVMSIPSMILFKNGKEIDRTVGALQKDAILELVEKTFN